MNTKGIYDDLLGINLEARVLIKGLANAVAIVAAVVAMHRHKPLPLYLALAYCVCRLCCALLPP